MSEEWNPDFDFAVWKTSVRVVVEANSFERQALWREFSSDATRFWRRVDLGRIEPELGGPDRMVWSEGRLGMVPSARASSAVLAAEEMLYGRWRRAR